MNKILGSSDLPRISCANHKINLAVRRSIKKTPLMLKDIRKLNIWISKIRKSVELTKVFANGKCRQRLDNETRWGSTFLMLEQIIKAEERGLLEEVKCTCPCKVPLATIKNYVSILLPAYLINIGLQRQSATIAEVVPCILRAISDWEVIKEKTSTTGKMLCECLIAEFRLRFDYELNSHLYQVTNVYRKYLLNISNLIFYLYKGSCCFTSFIFKRLGS